MKSKIDTIESAFILLGRDRNAMEKAAALLPEDLRENYIADYDLLTLIEGLNYEANGNKPWIPDYNNDDQEKYEPRFRMWDDKGKLAGSGFSYSHCDSRGTYSNAGSRHCFINYDVMRYAVDNFLHIYKRRFLRA